MYRVANTLKDYAIKALVSTVDHLGSVTYKANDMLDEKVVEVSGTELRISCVEQVILCFFVSSRFSPFSTEIYIDVHDGLCMGYDDCKSKLIHLS